jgi:hypothetical protein
MFFEVLSTAFSLLCRYPFRRGRTRASLSGGAIDDNRDFAHREECRRVLEEARACAIEFETVYRFWPGVNDARLSPILRGSQPGLSAEAWIDVFAGALLEVEGRGASGPIDDVVRALAPLFFLRSIRFWYEVGDCSMEEAEGDLDAQAESLRDVLYSRRVGTPARSSV